MASAAIKDETFEMNSSARIGDKVETIKTGIGAWFSADIIDISPNPICQCVDECRCTFKLVFEDGEDLEIVDRKLNQIRQVSYLSIDWDQLQVGMKVVINYNIDNPKKWGYWYDYVIEDLQKRDDVIYLKGTLLVGYEGTSKKIQVKIDSENVLDVLAIRPHMTLKEKEMEGYETGIKPDYCKKCKNKPKVKCKTCCCCKCGNKKDFELTVQCDECIDWYHIYCLEPPLNELPNDEDWYCPKCNNETHRAKLEMKQKLKRQKPSQRTEKKCQMKCKRVKRAEKMEKVKKVDKEGKVEKVQKSYEERPKSPEVLMPNSPKFEKDVETQVIIKEISRGSEIWKEVEKLYSEYEILRIAAEVVKKKKEEILTPSIEDFIMKDIANAHLWAEAKESITKGKKVFLETVKRIFTCAVCFELLNDPITLSCKHNFCIDCFFRSLSVNVYNCSLCRVDVIHTQHYVVNENLKKALALLFGKKLSKKIDA